MTGLISGIPRIAGTFTFTVRAINGIQPDASRSFSLLITGSGGATPTVPRYNSGGGGCHTGAFASLSLGFVTLFVIAIARKASWGKKNK
jgi:hypothetical protein